MRKRYALLLVLVFSLSIFAFGCQNTANKPINPNEPNNVRNNVTTPNNDATNLTDNEAKKLAKKLESQAENVSGVKRASVVVSDNTITGRNDMSNNMVNNRNDLNNTSDRLRNDITNPNVPGNQGDINNGVVGSNPNTNNTQGIVVMVGLELTDNRLDNATDTDNIQKNVASKIKASDSRISQVFVTTDASLMERIDKVAKDLANGKTVNAVKTDINNLWQNLTDIGPAF